MELVAKLTLPGRTKAYIAIDRLFNFGANSTADSNCVLTNVIAVGAITTDLIGELIHTRGSALSYNVNSAYLSRRSTQLYRDWTL